VSIERVKDTDLVYYLVAYDKNGRERGDDPDGVMSDRIATAIRDEQVTDVFLISHGWKGDIPAARDQYGRWIKAMAECEGDRREIRQRRPDFKSLIVGFHWPSLPQGDEELGAGAQSFAVPGAAATAPGGGSAGDVATAPLAPAVETLVDLYADRIADTPTARAAIRTIVTHAMAAGPSVDALPSDVADAYRILNDEAGMGGDGPAGHPGEDREPFDPNRAYRNARASASKLPRGAPGAAASPAFGGGGASALLSPLRQLSFWKMKDRGRTIGESAGFTLVKNMMAAAPAGRKVRFHLMGHSFGCIVVSGMIHGPNGTGTLPQPVSSLTLVQGATSLWGFCATIPETGKPGYFRRIIEQKKIEGPIVTTQSKRDTAVGRLYPIAAGIALQVDFPAGQFPKYGGLGSWGIQGPGLTLHDLAIGDATHAYSFEPTHIYNLECTGVIKDGTGASGAHSDIAKPEVAHALWEAVKAS
jgi:hypothetical protein